MTNDLISVILPVYNGGRFLSIAIESILHQSYKNLEFIIINDGSKDESKKIIEEYAKQDNRIIFINHQINTGLIDTLNEAIDKSKGNFIARMDQDDISTRDRIELQYKFLLANDLDICGGDFITIDENDEIKRKNIVPKTDIEILLTMASNVPFAHPSVMIKKEFLINNKLRYGLCGYKNAEDLDLWHLMHANDAKFGNLDYCVLKYRILSTSMSRVNNKRIKNEANYQFDTFVKKNEEKFQMAFEEIGKLVYVSNSIEQNVVKAVLRYLFITKNVKLFFKVIAKIKILNICIGLLSFLNFKYL